MIQQITRAARTLRLAHCGQHLLDTGRFQSLTEIAVAEGLDLAQVSRIARLAWVEPQSVDAMLANENKRVSALK